MKKLLLLLLIPLMFACTTMKYVEDDVYYRSPTPMYYNVYIGYSPFFNPYVYGSYYAGYYYNVYGYYHPHHHTTYNKIRYAPRNGRTGGTTIPQHSKRPVPPKVKPIPQTKIRYKAPQRVTAPNSTRYKAPQRSTYHKAPSPRKSTYTKPRQVNTYTPATRSRTTTKSYKPTKR